MAMTDTKVAVADIVRGAKSPGVARIEALSARLSTRDRVAVFLGCLVLAWAYGLDGLLRAVYQTYATNSYGQHSLLSTINVVRAVVAAAAQPTAAKLADVFGRLELLCVSVAVYVAGTVVEAVAPNVATFCAGGVLYQVGYTMATLLVEVIIGDITTTRTRLVFSYIPTLPFVVNTWISGDIVESAIRKMSWKWGIGMWAAIYPVCALPLIGSLAWVSIRDRVKEQGFGRYIARCLFPRNVSASASASSLSRAVKFCRELFWALDVIGIVLVIAVFGLILAPLTIAGGFAQKWKKAEIIAPLVVGVVCIPVFIFWELFRAPIPLVPFRLMKDRSVWAPIGIAIFYNFAWTIQADFLFTILQVAFGFSPKKATVISSVFSLVSVVVGVVVGLVVCVVRRLKIFIVVGTSVFMVAFGILMHFRGSTDASSGAKAGIIAAQAVLGLAAGLFTYATQASLQVQVAHEHMAVLTAIFLATYNIGSALGYTVAGALWTQLLPGKLEDRLAPLNATLAVSAYGEPLSFITRYPIGSPERSAMIDGYRSIQKMLILTGICVCVPLIGLGLCTRNPRLNDEQTLVGGVDELPGGNKELPGREEGEYNDEK